MATSLVLVYEIQDPGYILELPIVDGTIESIEWGDLTPSDNLTTHTYTDPGTYTVSITGTGITSFNYNNGSGQDYLIECTSFGEIGLTDASNMFNYCRNLMVAPATSPSTITNMSNMFTNARAFNGDISGWNTTNVTDMSSMFEDAIAFNQDISGWTTTNVTDMSSMFRDVTNFNQDISGWTTTNVTDMSSMFRNAQAFNQNIGGWTTTNVTDMSSMFRNAQAFNQPLDNWDVSSVETTYSMFYLAASFNQDLNSWDVSSVQDMSSMFESATAFNGNISNWTPTNVTDMSSMFSGATAFNQNIGNWNIASVIFMSNMLDGTALSITNYNALLNGWSIQTVQSGVSFGAQGLTYTSAGLAAHNILTGSPNAWTILGDTYLPPPVCFKEGSQILTDTGYKAIEMLRKGDLVKTSKNGFLPIDMIGKRVIYNPAEKERIKEQLYKCSKEQYPEVFEDLVITGCHSILVDRFASKEQREKAIEVNSGRLCITDKKYRLPACVDDRASVYEVKGDFTIYHIALENDDYYMNYGVYANGLLVETCSKRYLKELSKMELIE